MSTSTQAHTTHARGRQARETRDAQRYLHALFGRAQPGALIELRYRYRTGMRQRFLPATDLFTAARTIARLGISTDVYVGVAPRHHPAGDKSAITTLWTLWADLDDPDTHPALEQLPVAPAIVIATSPGHLHAYWPLTDPVSIPEAEQANHRLAAQLRADQGAVTSAATILRPPATYNFKTTPPTPVVLERCSPATSTLHAVTAGIAADPAPPTAPQPRSRPPTAGGGQDPLRALDPALYVGVLTGQRVGRSRKISCPFHDDRTPSLHVYDDPQRGWFCFGCGRGGSIYDLAGALWDLQTRGSDFLVLRARLYELFLPGQPPPAPPPSSNRSSRRTRRAGQP